MFAFHLRKAFSSSNINLLKSAFMSNSEAIKSEPKASSYGLLKASVLVAPCLSVGGWMSKNLACILEEWNIFVPDDDDDDD